MTVFYRDIQDAEAELTAKKEAYLRRFGWDNTCNTPGSYWLWKRDFADEDAKMAAIVAERKLPTPHKPYGIITADRDLAVSMTLRCLDQQEEQEEG